MEEMNGKGRNRGMRGVAKSCQKISEMEGGEGAAERYRKLTENGGNGGEGGDAVSCRGLKETDINGSREGAIMSFQKIAEMGGTGGAIASCRQLPH
jgi:hypothetical protein